MALRLRDRIKETSSTTGLVSIVLGGAVSGFQSFAAGVANGNRTFYAIVNRSIAEWEVGVGTLTTGPDTLSRDEVFDSSGGAGVKVNFGVGVKDIFVTIPAIFGENWFRIDAKTTDYTLKVSDIFKTITNGGAGGAVKVTIPNDMPTGFEFGIGADENLQLDIEPYNGTGDKVLIRGGHLETVDGASSQVYRTSQKGSIIRLKAITPLEYWTTSVMGNFAVST